ncbi:MAG: hypothetical protein MUF87_19310 [Anaerolineae bacterium]|jgi:hypothetical protein|nr:hypothetical protein [Anaerolineae bacterium]
MINQNAYSLLSSGLYIRESDPEQAMSLLYQGRKIAEEQQNHCLLIEFDHWIGSVLLFSLGKYGQALDVAVRATVEARKPQYQTCYERANVYRLLLDAYLFYDLLGYEDEIRETIELMETTMNPHLDLWCLLQWGRALLAIAHEDWDAAVNEGMVYFARCETASDFRRADAHALMCEIYARRQEWDRVQIYAQDGEIYANYQNDTICWYLELLAWQATIARRNGDETAAQRHHQQLQSLYHKLRSKPYIAFYDGLSAYYVAGGEMDAAIALRDQQLAWVLECESPYILSECRLRRCALLKQSGRDYQAEHAAALAVATHLIKPDIYQGRLARAVSDE